MSIDNDRARAHAEHNYNEFIIESWAPAREVHLLAGPSGAGKTTWLLKILETWERGESILGHKSMGGKWAYFPGDRSHADVKRTLDRLHVDKETFPFVKMPTSATNVTAAQIVEAARVQHPAAKLLVFEGLASYVPDGKLIDYRVVANFLKGLQQLCEKLDITIIGVVHSPKMTEKDRYNNPRERVMGSGAWGAYSNLILLLEPSDPEKSNSVRNLFVLPRNAKEERFTMDWRDGLLIPMAGINRTQNPLASNFELLVNYIDKVPANAMGLRLFSTAEMRNATGLSESSLHHVLNQAKTSGLVIQTKPGVYRVVAQVSADDLPTEAVVPTRDTPLDTVT